MRERLCPPRPQAEPPELLQPRQRGPALPRHTLCSHTRDGGGGTPLNLFVALC